MVHNMMVRRIKEWMLNIWHSQSNADDLEEMDYRFCCYLDHTAGLSKSNYTLRAIVDAFDEVNESAMKDYVAQVLNDMGLLSNKQYSDAVGGIYVQPDTKLSTRSALVTLKAARDMLMTSGNTISSGMIDSVIEEIETGMNAYI